MRGLVLASRSPQRRAILAQLGIEFEVMAPQVEEAASGPPRDLVTGNALAKAHSVAAAAGDRAVLGVDTAVFLDGRSYGKPTDVAEASAFLEALSGREHAVWSGLALLGAPEAGADVERREGALVSAAVTAVQFRRLERTDVDWYLGTGEWRERAGGYAIQGRGAALVERIAGDYSNVVGLPVACLTRLAPGLVRGSP